MASGQVGCGFTLDGSVYDLEGLEMELGGGSSICVGGEGSICLPLDLNEKFQDPFNHDIFDEMVSKAVSTCMEKGLESVGKKINPNFKLGVGEGAAGYVLINQKKILASYQNTWVKFYNSVFKMFSSDEIREGSVTVEEIEFEGLVEPGDLD